MPSLADGGRPHEVVRERRAYAGPVAVVEPLDDLEHRSTDAAATASRANQRAACVRAAARQSSRSNRNAATIRPASFDLRQPEISI